MKIIIIIIIKEERMHTYIFMGFRHSHIEISFTPKRIYRVIYIGRVKKINKTKIIIIKEERMHTCIVMEFRHSHIEISFTPEKIYRVIYIGRVPFEM